MMNNTDAQTAWTVNTELLQKLRSVKEESAVVRRCPRVNMDITIAYQTHGDRKNPCILLVMGLNGPLPLWDLEFCELLASKGFFVIRYDNRDVGLSTKCDAAGSPGLLKLLCPGCCCCGKVPYLLIDVAADGMALLDYLKIEKAHIVGISMGGMLAQTMAIEFPHKCLSLTSMSSTTGGAKQVECNLSMKLFLAKKPKSNSPHDIAVYRIGFQRHTGGLRSFDENDAYTRGIYTAERSNYMDGAFRHAGAIVYSGSRVEALGKLTLPTLVIHGDRDDLVPTENGYQTHKAIPGSRLVIVPGMGHIIFESDYDLLVDEIAKHAHAAEATAREPARPEQ